MSLPLSRRPLIDTVPEEGIPAGCEGSSPRRSRAGYIFLRPEAHGRPYLLRGAYGAQ